MCWYVRPLMLVVAGFLTVLSCCPLKADLVGHGGMIRAIDMSRDGRYVLTGSFDYSAIIWNFGDQSAIGRLDGHDGPVTSVSFLDNASKALTASDDMTVILWDVGKRKPIHRMQGHKHKVMTVVASGDGSQAASGGWDSSVMIWNLSTGNLERTIKTRAPVNSVTYLGSSDLVAIGGHDRTISIYNSSNARFVGKMEGHLMGITQLASSSDGKRLLSASIDGSIRLWDTEQFQELGKYEGHKNQVYSARFVNGDGTAISTGRDGTIIHWNLETGQKLKQIKAHKSIVWAVAPSSDGRFAVSAGLDETARIWHLASGGRIGTEIVANNEPKPWLESKHPGAKLYKKCARCHAFRSNLIQRSGPHLENLFGRKTGSVPGYHYSDALTGKQTIWSAETIFELFDKGPDIVFPGTKMPVQRVTHPSQLHQLVDYLKQLTSTDNQAN
jgi:cytochrome c